MAVPGKIFLATPPAPTRAQSKASHPQATHARIITMLPLLLLAGAGLVATAAAGSSSSTTAGSDAASSSSSSPPLAFLKALLSPPPLSAYASLTVPTTTAPCLPSSASSSSSSSEGTAELAANARLLNASAAAYSRLMGDVRWLLDQATRLPSIHDNSGRFLTQSNVTSLAAALHAHAAQHGENAARARHALDAALGTAFDGCRVSWTAFITAGGGSETDAGSGADAAPAEAAAAAAAATWPGSLTACVAAANGSEPIHAACITRFDELIGQLTEALGIDVAGVAFGWEGEGEEEGEEPLATADASGASDDDEGSDDETEGSDGITIHQNGAARRRALSKRGGKAGRRHHHGRPAGDNNRRPDGAAHGRLPPRSPPPLHTVRFPFQSWSLTAPAADPAAAGSPPPSCGGLPPALLARFLRAYAAAAAKFDWEVLSLQWAAARAQALLVAVQAEEEAAVAGGRSSGGSDKDGLPLSSSSSSSSLTLASSFASHTARKLKAHIAAAREALGRGTAWEDGTDFYSAARCWRVALAEALAAAAAGSDSP